MLQQTQVAAVIPFYRRFLERFPDVQALAEAPLDDVMLHWSGLGYYSRARNLHAAARRVVDAFDGAFPSEVDVLATLPGVGRSTAGAIAAFAFGRKAAILDGNVKRVLARVFLIDGDLASSAATARLWALTQSLLPDHDIERYTQGLMDLGATVCTPRRPTCLICPFETTCRAHRASREEEIPRRKRRKPVPERRTLLVMATREDTVFMVRRPDSGIWGGLWSLPELDPDDRDGLEATRRRFDAVDPVATAPAFVHAFTHFVLHADIVRMEAGPGVGSRCEAPDDTTRWMRIDDLASLGLPTPIRALLASLRPPD